MTMIQKPYRQNREMYPEILSKYCSQASMAGPNDPVYLDTQSMFGIIKTENKNKFFAWIKIRPRLRIFCPIRGNVVLEGHTVRDSKLFKIDNHYELHLVISKNVIHDSNPRAILSVDLGEKVLATAVLLQPCDKVHVSKPIFLGRSVRGLRRHYAYLRKKLGQKKLQKVINRIGNTESRKINEILHKISKEIVEIAKNHRAVILIGDLTGIRKSSKGKKMNRIVANMPYYKLTQYITYKANWEGIPIVITKEWYSSKMCSKCSSDYTTRPYQGLFRCHDCGYRCNADYNGAKNLGKRLMKHAFVNGTLGFGCKSRTPFCDSASSSMVKPLG